MATFTERYHGVLSARMPRRAALVLVSTGVGAVAGGAAVGTLDRIKFLKVEPEPEPPIPEGVVDPFKIGKTTFAFESDWTQSRRLQIRKTIEDIYPKMYSILGTEPTDMSGRTGILSVITSKPVVAENHVEGQTHTRAGTRRHDIDIDHDVNDFVIAHELGHVFWGTTHISLTGKSTYHPFQEGFPDVVAQAVGKDNENFDRLREVFHLSPLDYFQIYNKRKIATDGSFVIGLQGVRRLLTALALKDLLQLDPNFLSKFRRNYLKFWTEALNLGQEYSEQDTRDIIKSSFSGNFDTLASKHQILQDAEPGKHIIIANYFEPSNKKEYLYAYVLERSVDGFIENVIPQTSLNIQLWVDKKQTTQVPGVAANGAMLLAPLEDIGRAHSGKEVTFKVQASFGATDEFTFTPKPVK